MNKEQTEELILKIQARWPNSKISLDCAGEWASVLETNTIDELELALNTYGIEGKIYAPNVYDLKNRIPKPQRREESDPEKTLALVDAQKARGLTILAYKNPKGWAWRWFPIELAERRGRRAEVPIDGMMVSGFVED